MVAAYAALVSLVNVRDHVKIYHSLHEIFNAEQLQLLETLHQKVSFLLEFLERYSLSSDESEILESRVTDAAHVAEDIIETCIIDDVSSRFQKISPRNVNRLIHFRDELQGVIESFDSIEREVEVIKEKGITLNDLSSQKLDQVISVGFPSTGENTIVGFDRDLDSIINKLNARESNLQIISITGMGGIGKSTLAKKVFDDNFTKQRFDVCGWVTASQEFDVKDMLLGLLSQIGGYGDRNFEVHQLGDELHKQLFGRRYFVIIDDIWSVEAWDRVQLYLPKRSNSSLVIVTTRLLNLAEMIGSSLIHRMSLLDGDESWRLLCTKVFAKESCRPELVGNGKKIAIKCEGLPLSITVIAGLLAKSRNLEYWESIAGKISSSVNSEDNERCLKILDLSYRHLPIHLKACFLYIGMYPEDHEIYVPELIKLWVAEGFLKPGRDRILEEIANDYLQELLVRNLIIVNQFGYMGTVEKIKIHDLVRDLCIREAYKERMFSVVNVHDANDFRSLCSHRRLAISNSDPREKNPPPCSQSPVVLRSFICDKWVLSSKPPLDVKLLRVMRTPGSCLFRLIPELFNTRFLEFNYSSDKSNFFSSVNLFWNLQTICLSGIFVRASREMWEMPQLRHVIAGTLYLPDPKRQDNIVLENLQTLRKVIDFRCTEEVLQKIPNIRELGVKSSASDTKVKYMWSSYCLGNLARLQKIETLMCESFVKHEREGFCMGFNSLGFSPSLKVVSLLNCDFNWEDFGTKIALLPRLEVLKLEYCHTGREWNSVEDQFPCLKVLEMVKLDLVRWTAESCDFPSLERLVLEQISDLEEIPSDIGEITTLQCIDVSWLCSRAIRESAKRIQEEQESLGIEISVLLQPREYKPVD